MCPFSYYPPIYVRVSQEVPSLNIFQLKCMLDIVGTVYRLLIYMQSNKIHKVF